MTKPKGKALPNPRVFHGRKAKWLRAAMKRMVAERERQSTAPARASDADDGEEA